MNDERVKCWAAYRSTVVAGTKSKYVRKWGHAEACVDFYDSRGYQVWLPESMVFDSKQAAEEQVAINQKNQL